MIVRRWVFLLLSYVAHIACVRHAWLTSQGQVATTEMDGPDDEINASAGGNMSGNKTKLMRRNESISSKGDDTALHPPKGDARTNQSLSSHGAEANETAQQLASLTATPASQEPNAKIQRPKIQENETVQLPANQDTSVNNSVASTHRLREAETFNGETAQPPGKGVASFDNSILLDIDDAQQPASSDTTVMKPPRNQTAEHVASTSANEVESFFGKDNPRQNRSASLASREGATANQSHYDDVTLQENYISQPPINADAHQDTSSNESVPGEYKSAENAMEQESIESQAEHNILRLGAQPLGVPLWAEAEDAAPDKQGQLRDVSIFGLLLCAFAWLCWQERASLQFLNPFRVAVKSDARILHDHIQNAMLKLGEEELRELCHKHGVPKHGSKADMIVRIRHKLGITQW